MLLCFAKRQGNQIFIFYLRAFTRLTADIPIVIRRSIIHIPIETATSSRIIPITTQ